MQKKRLAVTCLVGWFIVTLASLTCAQQGVKKADFRIAPYLQNTSPTGVTIMWETPEPCTSLVGYGVHAKSPDFTETAEDNSSVKLHRVRIENLSPDTLYRYQVRYGKKVHTSTFHTAPSDSRPIRFLIVGDTLRWGGGIYEKSALPEFVDSQNPEFALNGGDLVDRGTHYDEWPEHFDRFSTLTARIPMFAARGSHEKHKHIGAEDDWFGKYFELPGGEPHSSFDWGYAHIAVISWGHLNTSECRAFLDEDFSSTDKPWKIIIFHRPVYSTGYRSYRDSRKVRGNKKLEAIFDKHNVALVITAHTHIYERSFALRGGKRDDRNGTVYLVQGGLIGGDYPEEWSAVIPRDITPPHCNIVDVDEKHLEVKAFGLSAENPSEIEKADHYIQWRDEALPKKYVKQLSAKEEKELIAAIESLGAMMYQPASSRILAFLDDPRSNVRQEAALALERIADSSVSKKLLPYLRNPDPIVRRHAARALEGAMAPECADTVTGCILDSTLHERVRESLLGALYLHVPDKALPVSLKVLQAAKSETVRERAGSIVKRLAETDDIAVLTTLSEREANDFVLGCLTLGLNRITGKTVNATEVIKTNPGEDRKKYIDTWLSL